MREWHGLEVGFREDCFKLSSQLVASLISSGERRNVKLIRWGRVHSGV